MTDLENKDKDDKKIQARYEKARARRRALVKNGQLYIAEEDKDPNFIYRIVNDKEGSTRVQGLMNLGYDIVTAPILMGDGGLNETSKFGSAVSKSVGDGMTGILMRIPKELYEEGRDLLEEKNKEIDKSLGNDKDLKRSFLDKKILT